MKEINKQTKSLRKETPQFPYISPLRYFHTWAQSIRSDSEILVLAQRLRLEHSAGVKDQMVHDGWDENV